MVREDKSLAYEEYFWQDIELDGKVILDAGTRYGITTTEIASRMKLQRLRGRIISVDIDPESFELARKRLQEQELLDLVILQCRSFMYARNRDRFSRHRHIHAHNL